MSGSDETRDSVRRFYDEVGWQRDEASGGFRDGALFDDLRPLTAPYRRRANERVRERVGSGRRLLDAASGPVQYDDYVRFSDAFRRRVCLDLSLRALREASARLGDHALGVCGDLSALPFRDGQFAGVVSLHTLYHVPAGEQERALHEICRVLAPSSRAVLVVSWPRSAWNRLLTGLARRILRGRVPPSSVAAGSIPPLYFHPRDEAWLRRGLPEGIGVEIASWRSVSVDFLRLLPEGRVSALVLRALTGLEDRCPRLLGRIGLYPLVVLHRQFGDSERIE